MTLAIKRSIHAELLSIVSGDLNTIERAHRATREAATHEEAKPENDKDTRALEQSYLARGQAKRIEELRAGVADIEAMPLRLFSADEAVKLGAIVELSDDRTDTTVFVAPYGGGSKLANGSIQVVTPRSPLGRGLVGRQVGDECEVTQGGKSRHVTISRVL